MPWEYPDECFQTLCECCHYKAEFLKWMLTDGLTYLRRDFSNKDVDEIFKSIESKVNNNFHHESTMTYIQAIKQTIQL